MDKHGLNVQAVRRTVREEQVRKEPHCSALPARTEAWGKTQMTVMEKSEDVGSTTADMSSLCGWGT